LESKGCVKSGEHKDIGSPFREMTPDEKKIVQDVIDNVHQQFIELWQKGGKWSGKKCSDRRWQNLTGERPNQLGLVDEMGIFRTQADVAARMGWNCGETQCHLPQERVFRF